MKINKTVIADENNLEKEKIIRFVLDYYLKEGFYKTSMDTLSAQMRMSKKTIYKYFPSKEALVEEVIKTIMSEVQSNVENIIKSDSDAVSKIKHFHEILSRTLARFSDKWLNDIRTHMPELWVRVDEFRTKKMFSILSGILEQGKKEGLFMDKPNEILVTLFTSSLRAIVNPEFLYYNKFSYTEAVTLTFDILFNGVLTKEGKKTYSRKIKEM